MPDVETIERALASFRGTLMQQPPAFSAKKIAGVRSHALARQQRARHTAGEPAAKTVSVWVEDLQLLGVEGSEVRLRLTCSAGFYVRALARDLGRQLGTGAHLAALRRTRAGDCRLEDAISLDAISGDSQAAAAAVVPMGRMLSTLPAAALSDEGVRRARHGRSLGSEDLSAPLPAGTEGFTRLLDPAGNLVGIAEPEQPPCVLHPVVILV
jgi:tRNA pseudouridine55 synthase